jgi:hypothetical protein
MGFEPTRAEPIGLAVQRLNHSATSSSYPSLTFLFNILSETLILSKLIVQHFLKAEKKGKNKNSSHAGSWTRAFWVKARYPSR